MTTIPTLTYVPICSCMHPTPVRKITSGDIQCIKCGHSVDAETVFMRRHGDDEEILAWLPQRRVIAF